MFGLPLAFAAPLLLTALVGLPALWYLLRLTPPPPRLSPLPTLPLVKDLAPEEQRPTRTPWWLLLLRCLIAALIILAMAGPIWNPNPVASSSRSGPLVIVLDDGWSASTDWRDRAAFVERMITAARDRPVALRTSSEPVTEIVPGSNVQALDKLRSLEPQSHAVDRRAILERVGAYLAANAEAEALVVSDGVSMGADVNALEELSASAGDRLTVINTPELKAVGLAGVDNSSDAMTSKVLRVDTTQPFGGIVRALDQRGRSLGEAPVAMGVGTADAEVKLELPLELRNDVARLEIANIESAGAVQLVDDSNRRRRVGLVSGETADTAQPLVSPAYFIRKALEPFAEIREAPPNAPDPIERLIGDGATMLIMADVGTVSGAAYARLAKFVEDGGVLVRFAGGRLAAAGDDLLPVKLRSGGRTLGGALSWDQPKKLAPFSESSPFAGLKTSDEVTVTRQVLADPEGDVNTITWASLEDGTPLVTGAARGKGVVALFHITADTSWSTLPLSGLFVDMLRRLVATANAGLPNGDTDAGADLVAPTRMLDGFGRFRAPPATARAIARNRTEPATFDHPAGLYGPQEAIVAVNVMKADAKPARLAPATNPARTMVMATADPIDLRAPLMILALLLFALDAIATMTLGGVWARLRKFRPAAAAIILTAALASVLLVPIDRADAQETPATKPVQASETPAPQPMKRDKLPNYSLQDIEAALETRFAYVITGDRETDETSKQGLEALSRFIAFKTSLEPAEPVGVDPAKDELVFYPLIYWPMTSSVQPPSEAAVGRLDAYMRNGGTVIFDTRDAFATPPGSGQLTPETAALRAVLGTLDVPALEPIPTDHVVTKSFYLLDRFVGRYANGQTWIEALPPESQNEEGTDRPARAGDRVSPIIITSNDLAAAWAVDQDGNARYPLATNEAQQRDLAFRAGVNIVIYALTGNYKTDQVHVPALLERLGQ
jgi:hypothetical protein